MSVNFTPQKSAAGAKQYFSHGDYLGTEIVGDWHGKLAAELGLVGPVDQVVFEQLCDNRKPDGERLTPYDANGRVVGMDVTFNCPKSLSVLYQRTQDERIMKVFRRCVKETITEIEAEMRQPITRNRRQTHPITANILAAEFIHLTARPVGGIPDPHLHAHVFVFNATRNLQDGHIRSGFFRQIKANAPLFEAGFHSRLAHAVRHELGLAVAPDGKGFWRVNGIPKSVERLFSRRTQKIEEVARSLGIEQDKSKVAQLAKITREAKTNQLSPTTLRRVWNSVLSDEEWLEIEEAVKHSPALAIAPSIAVDRTLSHDLERSSIVSEQCLTIGALKRSFGACTPEDVHSEILREADSRCQGRFHGERFFTSKLVFEEEQALLKLVRDGRGGFRSHGHAGFEINDLRVKKNKAQVEAIHHVLQSNDQVISIIGSAGVGKTTLMAETVRGINQTGIEVFALAPTNRAVEVLAKDGFENSFSLARFLLDSELQEAAQNQVIWVDESGLVSVPQMLALLQFARKQDCRILLTGDDRQHNSVERGDALRLIHELGGITPAIVRTIVRQKQKDLKEAIQSLALGEVVEGFEKLDALGAILEISGQDRHLALADDFVKAFEMGKTALAIAPTHAEGEAVTCAIRENLKALGKLGNTRSVTQLRPLHFTKEEKGDDFNFQTGMVIEFHQNAKGSKLDGLRLDPNAMRLILDSEIPSSARGKSSFQGLRQDPIKRGTRLEIVSREDSGTALGKDKNGKLWVIPVWDAEKFSVYEKSSIELAVNDLLRITANGTCKSGHRLTNGKRYQVAKLFPNGDIGLKNGWRISGDFGHITHGYVSTSVASQGSTVDQVFIAEGIRSGKAASPKQLYVSASRARESVSIYTEDKPLLLDLVRKESVRLSATELLQSAQNERKANDRPPTSAHLAQQSEIAAKRGLSGLMSAVREKGTRFYQALDLARRTVHSQLRPIIQEIRGPKPYFSMPYVWGIDPFHFPGDLHHGGETWVEKVRPYGPLAYINDANALSPQEGEKIDGGIKPTI